MAAFDLWILPNKAPTDASMGHFCKLIDASEKERAARYKCTKHRNEFIYRRMALRMVLANYLEIGPQEISFLVNPFGKPCLTPSDIRPTIHFNVSVTQSTVAIAVCPEEQIGVDIEDCRSDFDVSALASLALTSSEMSSFADVPFGERAYEFFRYWVAKESVLKANGTGLSISPHTIEVDLEEGQTVLPGDVRRNHGIENHHFCFSSIGSKRICAIATQSIPNKHKIYLYDRLPIRDCLEALEPDSKFGYAFSMSCDEA